MNREINNVLKTLSIQPVLIDIGASGAPPKVWKPIARHAIYVGFDPDRRDLHDVPDGVYARSIIVNEAVTTAPGQSEVQFHLTHSPYCSSMLPPDTDSLGNYLFSDLFVVEREVCVPASSLNAVIDRLGLQGVDWFKTDSQGTDLRLFQSLRDDLRNRVLAIDIEPGLIDTYRGEDLFVDAHKELLRQGFWLSSLDVKGSVRMRRSTLQTMASHHSKLKDTHIYQSVRPSPGWCEARYLRTLESLREKDTGERDYALLWVFALLDRQPGFALDLALEYKKVFGKDNVFSLLWETPSRQVQRRTFKTAWKSLKTMAPAPLKQFLKRLL